LQANDLGEIGTSGEYVARPTRKLLFKRITDLLVERLKLFDFSESLAVRRIHDKNALGRDGLRVFEGAFLEVNPTAEAGIL
jgi:hypothetical protein